MICTPMGNPLLPRPIGIAVADRPDNEVGPAQTACNP